ncbi:hypothetical protein B0H10DRAFT_1958891 [Mycena sp. CBHHK59/15]|nr:hypothetical protein B0H10DRAFT_1958891 [Mycena sp. CBHHK59/15]
MYDTFVEEAQAAHDINSTFFPAKPDQKGNIYYQKADGTPFVAIQPCLRKFTAQEVEDGPGWDSAGDNLAFWQASQKRLVSFEPYGIWFFSSENQESMEYAPTPEEHPEWPVDAHNCDDGNLEHLSHEKRVQLAVAASQSGLMSQRMATKYY